MLIDDNHEDPFFLQSINHQAPPQLPPLSPLCHSLQTSSEELEVLLELEQPSPRMGTVLLEIAVDPEQQSVRPQVKGKSPPFGLDDLSPTLALHSQHPSTIDSEANGEFSVPFLLFQHPSQNPHVKELLQYLLAPHQPSDIPNPSNIILDDLLLQQVHDILSPKLQSLKKTREQLLKYSLRKACTFISNLTRKQNRHNQDIPTYAQQYCMAGQFRLSGEKINATLISKLFEDEEYRFGYQKFLDSFQKIVEEDNQHKIGYLNDQVQHALRQGNTSILEGIKRLPWPRKILIQAKRVAVELFEGKVKGKSGRNTQKPQ